MAKSNESVVALGGNHTGWLGASHGDVDGRAAMVHEGSAKIHPADVPARLSLQRAICERPADSGVQRTVGKQSTVDLHRAHGISTINQGGFAERHICWDFPQPAICKLR